MTVSASPPVIPPPPPGGGKRRKKKSGFDKRWLVFLGAAGAGVGLGMGGYNVVGAVRSYFDYLVALML